MEKIEFVGARYCDIEVSRGDAYRYLDDGHCRFYPNITTATYRRILRSRRGYVGGVFVNSPMAEVRLWMVIRLEVAGILFWNRQMFFLNAVAMLARSVLLDWRRPDFAEFEYVGWVCMNRSA